MVWFLVAQIFSTLISLIQIGRLSETDKDLEIMVNSRYQLGIAEHKMQKLVRANRTERMTLAVLAGRLKKQTNRPTNQFKNIIQGANKSNKNDVRAPKIELASIDKYVNVEVRKSLLF